MAKKHAPLIRSRPTLSVTPKQLIRMLKLLKKKERCTHAKLDPHTCPYLLDVFDDKRTKCRCCDKCQEFCADEI